MDSALPISSTISSISTKDVNTVIRALHKTLMDVNLAAECVSQKFLGTNNININSNAADDKRIMAPQSINPQSMSNPMSVNMPNSVKSISDEKISLGQMNDSSDVIENPIDVYNNSINNFLNTCDEIKKNLQISRRMHNFEGKYLLQSNKNNLANGLQNRVRSTTSMKRPAALIIPEDFIENKKLYEKDDINLVADDFNII